MTYGKKEFAEMLLSCGFSVKDTMKITQSTKSSVYRWVAELKENPYSLLNVNNTEEEKKT